MDFNQTTPYDTLLEKWSPVVDHPDMPKIDDIHRRRCTAVLLENQKRAMNEQAGVLNEVSTNNIGTGFVNSNSSGAGTAGGLAGYDPILISLVRRAMPNIVAYDVAAVQPMTAPTGLIFAMKANYDSKSGVEAFFDEPISYSGVSAYGTALLAGASGNSVTPIGAGGGRIDNMTEWRGMLTGTGEALGDGSANSAFKEMGFSIERVAVNAKTRALKAEYTTELAQDLRAVHGLDAESELANILSVEILNEINREVLRTVYTTAITGARQSDLANQGGVYDLNLDSDGRWSAERFRGLMFQIEREANAIAKATRRGKGNFIITSADVASALAMGGFLNLSPALNVNLNADDTGNIFAGILNNKMKVFIDPFATAGVDFACVGYKGASPYDAGIFYCPYVPLQMVRAVGQDTFQPKIGFKTRYGMAQNPFARGRGAISTDLESNTNQYYRIFRVTNIHGNGI
jgi:Major capsid protein Gp23